MVKKKDADLERISEQVVDVVMLLSVQMFTLAGTKGHAELPTKRMLSDGLHSFGNNNNATTLMTTTKHCAIFY